MPPLAGNWPPRGGAGPRWRVGGEPEVCPAGGQEPGARIAAALRPPVGRGQPVGSQDGGAEAGRTESGDRVGRAMGSGRAAPRVWTGMFPPRQRSGADGAASGHEAVCHAEAGPHAPRGRSGARRHKTLRVPWAEPQGRFPLLFERCAGAVLLARGSIRQGGSGVWRGGSWQG